MLDPKPNLDSVPVLTQRVGSMEHTAEVLLGHGRQRLDVCPGLEIHKKGLEDRLERWLTG